MDQRVCGLGHIKEKENYTWKSVKTLEISWKNHGILSLRKTRNPAYNLTLE